MTSFLDFYHGHGQRLNKEMFAAKEKIKQMEDEIKVIDDRLSELAPLGQTEETSFDDKYVQLLPRGGVLCLGGSQVSLLPKTLKELVSN